MADPVKQMDGRKKDRISIVDTYKNLVSNITSDHIFYIQVAVTILIGFLILYVLTRRVFRRVTRGRNIVLVGGCEAGKTALLYTLTAGKTPITVTSFKENTATYNTAEKSVQLVDLPGHERIRTGAFEKHKNDARALVFLLDSSTLHVQVREVAEQLFGVLTDSTIQSHRCPVAVVCNKQDKELAKSAIIVERALQREIDVLRETSSSRLASISSSATSSGNQSSSAPSLGIAGKAFQFSQLVNTPVTFMETSILDADSLDELSQWILEVS